MKISCLSQVLALVWCEAQTVCTLVLKGRMRRNVCLNHKSLPPEANGLAGPTLAGSPHYLKDFGNACQRSLVWSQLHLSKSHRLHLPPPPVRRTEIINKVTSGHLKSFQEFLSLGMRYFLQSKYLNFKSLLWCTLNCSSHTVTICLKSDFFSSGWCGSVD